MASPIRFRTILKLIVVAGIGYFLYEHFASPGGSGGWAGAGGPVPVSVAQVVERDARQWHEYSGRLVAVDQADVRPRVSGIVEAVHFSEGALVNKDDILFTIDPRPYQTVLQSTSAKAVLAESEMRRAQKLLADKAIPQHEYDQRKNDVEVARADLARAKLDLDFTQVKAPIAGRVSRAEVTVGNLVQGDNNAPLLTTVVTSNPIYADFEIDEPTLVEYAHAGITGNKDVEKVPVKMALTGENDATHIGHIQSFDNRLNSSSGTIRVRAVFDNADSVLIPGLFAHIRLGGAQETPSLLITDRAVGTDQSKKFVLVVGKDNKVEHREVTLGAITDDGLRIVLDGLKPGEKIIVSGTQRVMMPGQEVKPELVAMDAKESDPPAAPPKDTKASEPPAGDAQKKQDAK